MLLADEPNIRETIAFPLIQNAQRPTTLCNLNCGYCYLPERATRKVMPLAVAQAVAVTVARWVRHRPVEVVWHGGEPLTTGRQHLGALMDCFPPGVTHTVQTNATLIDESWIEFFQKRSVKVGVSLDGAEGDTASRVDWRGNPAYERAVCGIRLLIERGHDVAMIAVVADPTADRARRLYSVAAGLGCRWLGVNIEETEGVNRRANRHDPQQVIEFWATLTDAWNTDRRVQVRDVGRVLAYTTALLDEGHDEWSDTVIDPLPTVAYDGLVTLISSELAGFSSPRTGDFACGNVRDTPLHDLIRVGLDAAWVTEFVSGVGNCRSICPYFGFCGGGTPANRFFELGRLDGTQTDYCRNSKIALLEGVLHHASDLGSDRGSSEELRTGPAAPRSRPPTD